MPLARDATPSTVLLEEPATPREALVDAIALECATGATVAQLAVRFGYSYGGMARLC